MDTLKIWNDFNDQLLNFIRTKVHDKDAANDILQDVFVKIHSKLSTLSSSEKLTSWIYQITRNSIVDYFRKQKQMAPIKEQAIGENINPDEEMNIEKCLKPFLNQLSPQYKDALLKTDLGNLSQKEYAHELNISYSGAKSRVQRGREQLKKLITECCNVVADKYGNIVEYHCQRNCGC